MTGGPFIDVSKFPPDERPHVIEMAVKVNALKEDVDGISGSSQEEKQATYAAMGSMRKLLQTIHGHRFNAALISFQLYLVVVIVKSFGIRSDQLSHLVDILIKILEKFSSQ